MSNRRDSLFSVLDCCAAFVLAAMLTAAPVRAQTNPLPSWNDTGPKSAITAFVEKVTKQGSPDFVPEAQRIAVFDNDGTLWVEQPLALPSASIARAD